jgi:hypothetical protein
MTYRVWETLSDRSKIYEPADFERAAYRLFTSQVLTAAEPTTRKDYHLVADHVAEFQQAFAPFNVELRHNAQFQYLVARPRHVLRQRMASKAESLFVLVLADLYHRVRFQGQEDDFGQAPVDLEQLGEAYKTLAGRDIPGATELRQLLAAAERWGIARREDTPGELNAFRVQITPVIAELVTSDWLDHLAALRKPGDDDDADDAEDADGADEGSTEGDDV